jgi:hypothetical protein
MPKANLKSNNEPFVMSCFFNSFVSHLLLLQCNKATDFSRLQTSQEPLCEDEFVGISFKSKSNSGKQSSTERKIEI